MPEVVQTLDLLNLIDPVQDARVSTEENRWEKSVGLLKFTSRSGNGEIAAPVDIRSAFFQLNLAFRAAFRTEDASSRIHTYLPVKKEGEHIAVRIHPDGRLILGPPASSVSLRWSDMPTSEGRISLRWDARRAGSEVLQIFREGKLISEWKGDASSLAGKILSPHRNLGMKSLTGLYSYGTLVEFSEFTLSLFEGEAVKVAPAAKATVAASTPSTPATSGPAAAPWLVEALRLGGKIKTFGSHHENGEVLPDELAKFQDFIQITANSHGWGALRKSGEFMGCTWSRGYPNGARKVNAVPASYLARSHHISFRDARDGSYRNIWGGSSQHRLDLAHAGSSMVQAVSNHLMALSPSGEVLIARHWSGSDFGKPPPDMFQGAVSVTSSAGLYIVARSGGLVQAWEPHKQQRKDIATLPEEVAGLDAGPNFVIICTSSGKVVVRADQGGEASGKISQVPSDLPPAIAVRAGEGMCAAQAANGQWTAWGDSVELIELTRKIGPALDVDFYVHPKDPKVRYLVWVEPTTAAPDAVLSAQTPVTGDEMTQRLAQIAAQFQAAYERDILPAHNSAVADLDTKYLAAVNRALDAATQRSALEEAVKLREEAQRVTARTTLPSTDPDNLPESLRKLRSTYRISLDKLVQDRDLKAGPYFDRYDQLLEAYQKELTQQQRLDDALKVKARREDLARNRSVPSAPAASKNLGQPLFDGRTLTGWHVHGDKAGFDVRDGCIHATGARANLLFDGRGASGWKDFELNLKVRLAPMANSGLWIHADTRPTQATAIALEVQLDANEGNPQKTGSIYHIAPASRSVTQAEQWFDMKVVVQKKNLTVFINGNQVSSWTQPAAWKPPGNVSNAYLRSGTIGFQSHTGQAWFKDIHLKEL